MPPPPFSINSNICRYWEQNGYCRRFENRSCWFLHPWNLKPVNQIRFDPKYARFNIPDGRNYTGPELPLPVPSLPQAETGHQEADGGGNRDRDPISPVSSRHKIEAKTPQKEATCTTEVDKNRNQPIGVIESQQSGNDSGNGHSPLPCSGNSLAKLNRMELRNLVENPQTAKPKARNELDKVMQEHKTAFPKINLNQELKKSEASQVDGDQDLEEPRVTKKEAPDVSLTQEEYFEPGPAVPSSSIQVKDEAGSEPPEKKCKQSSSQSDDLTSQPPDSPQGEGRNVLQAPDLFHMMEPEDQVHSTSTDIINNNSNDVSGHQDNETDINSTEEVSVSKPKKKPAAKSPVENVFARKIKVMKDLNKKEFEVMKSIDGLDKETSDLKKMEKIIEMKKKEKIKELKVIQKERRAVLNA